MTFLHDSRFEKLLDKMKKPWIAYPFLETSHHPVMVDVIKEAFNICFKQVVGFLLHDHMIDLFETFVRISSRTISIRDREKCRFKDASQYPCNPQLHHLVYDGGYP